MQCSKCKADLSKGVNTHEVWCQDYMEGHILARDLKILDLQKQLAEARQQSNDEAYSPEKITRFHAIVAINVSHEVFLMLTLPNCPNWVATCDPDFDLLKEIEDHSPAGLYFIEFIEYGGCTSVWGHVGSCPGDCGGEYSFEILGPATMNDVIKWRGRG